MISSSPQDGAEVHRAPSEVSFSFSEPLDPSSSIQVKDACGRPASSGTTNVELNEMSTSLVMKPSGRYVATYKAVGLGGVTGTEEGSITFTVHFGPSCGDGSGGGGHGNHGNDGGGNGKNHGGHDRQGSNDHSKHGSGDGGSHSGGDHSTSTHGDGNHRGGNHAAGKHGGGGHRQGGRNQKHGKHKGGGGHRAHKSGPGDANTLAAPLGVPQPDGETVALALGFSILLGAGGGILVRLGVRL